MPQALKDGIDAIKISHKKMSPFSVPYSMTSMASAVLAMDLVSFKDPFETEVL